MLVDFCKTYFNFYEINISKLVMSEAFNIQHYKQVKVILQNILNEMEVSTYERVLVFMTYLNDVEDGGGTHFRLQNLTTKAKKSLTLICPLTLHTCIMV